MIIAYKNRHLVTLLACLALAPTGCDGGTTDPPVDTGTTTSTGAGGTGGGDTGGGGTGGEGTGGAAQGGGGAGPVLPDLDKNLVWYGENRVALDEMIDKYGMNSPGYDAASKPVAVFDWDNTVIKNDVGDITMFWMLKNDKILQPPNKNWSLTSHFLTDDAKVALNAACDLLANPGEALPTSTNVLCADEITTIYTTGVTTLGDDAFAGWSYRTMEPAYGWTVQLQAGYKPSEINEFAKSAIDAGLAAAIDATQMIGSKSFNAYVRIYDQIADLITVLQQNGFDVWVASASSQHIVEVFAEKVGIAADHVIGVRAITDANGLLTSNFQGCGPVEDGKNDGQGNVLGNSIITYIEGKRCWVNKQIYGDMSDEALNPNPDMKKRIVFGAGDSDTDISFLVDSIGLKLAVNRNKNELMCYAYNNYMKTWLINPMFLGPKGKFAAGYPCSTTACKDMAGAGGPCTDEGGALIQDQQDTVFGP